MKKEDVLLKVIFNEPSRHWHFEELLKAAKISRPQAAQWLKKFVAEGLVKRVKPEGKMPYYLGDHEDPRYQARKRLFALETLEKQGFLSHLAGLPKARAVILFGSMARWDWYKNSDIDVFIYGDPEGFKRDEFWAKLGREIETFICKDAQDLKRFPKGLLRNILEGYLVKGTLDFIKVAYA
ncbi:Nucleotidyltransferase domain protein [uncultured archaeon]|nr:Nucleotidyltransferase domain protein [uncultured archaeon]